KLASVTISGENGEAMYMLATYCFDAQRKMMLMFKALNAALGATLASQTLAQTVYDQTSALDDPAVTTWADRAATSEQLMLEVYADVRSAYDTLVSDSLYQP